MSRTEGRRSKPDEFDTMLDGMVRDGTLTERLDERGEQQFSLSGKGLLDAQTLVRRVSGQPDACRCDYLLYPTKGTFGVLIHKPNEDCEWHIEAVKRLVAETVSESDKPHAVLFVFALDENRCNACGKPAVRTTNGGTQECSEHDTRTLYRGA